MALIPAIAPVIGFTQGDTKLSFLTADHSGFYILDGRSVNSLPAPQKGAAIAAGFPSVLPSVTPMVVGGNPARRYIYLGV